MTEREYVLGTGSDELNRLAQQHRLWSDVAMVAYRRAGIRPGQRVLDVGCGPGFAAFDLAQLVTSTGAVVGIDEATGFVAWANQQAAQRGLPQLRCRSGDVQQLAAALADEAAFDLAYARWVLCFVADPAAVVRGVADRLRPGGRFVVHDYFNYGAMTLAPRRRSHDLAVAATMRAWRDKGGDPDIAGRLPAMLTANGFRIEHMEVHQRIARGCDSMFAWPDAWWRTFAPKLVDMGLLAAKDRDELFADLSAIAKSDTDFVHCPPVYEVIATKR